MNDILKLNVGIAGCGTMGLPMLEVLLKNGVNAFGYDVKSKENFPTLKENFISSKVNFFEKSDIIFSAVRDINQTVELCEGKNGLFKVNTQKILIISSTLSPAGDKVELIISIFWVFTLKSPFLPSQSSTV